MTGAFELATAVDQQAESRFSGEIHDRWGVVGVPNGGYVLAIAARAMTAAAGRPPLSVTAHYLGRARPGPCAIEVETIRLGRRMATLAASVFQDDAELLRVLGTFGASSGEDPILVDGGPPELPPYEECVAAAGSDQPPYPALNERLAARWRPGDEGFMRGAPTGRAEIAGWFAFVDHTPVDQIGLLLACDACAPPVFNIGLGPGWVPTLELTVHIRAAPAPGLLRFIFRTRYIQGGLLSEDGEIWDADGVLVAESRQLALTPRM